MKENNIHSSDGLLFVLNHCKIENMLHSFEWIK